MVSPQLHSDRSTFSFFSHSNTGKVQPAFELHRSFGRSLFAVRKRQNENVTLKMFSRSIFHRKFWNRIANCLIVSLNHHSKITLIQNSNWIGDHPLIRTVDASSSVSKTTCSLLPASRNHTRIDVIRLIGSQNVEHIHIQTHVTVTTIACGPVSSPVSFMARHSVTRSLFWLCSE